MQLGLERYCGVEYPPDVVVSGRDVVVKFFSDFFGSGVGFKMEWSYSDGKIAFVFILARAFKLMMEAMYTTIG